MRGFFSFSDLAKIRSLIFNRNVAASVCSTGSAVPSVNGGSYVP